MSESVPSPRIELMIHAGGWSTRREIDRPVVLGRSSDSDIVVPDAAVSRRHVRLTPTAHGVLVEDLDSRGGTRVDGNVVNATTLCPLGGDVEIGETSIRVDRPQASTLQLSGDARRDGALVESFVRSVAGLAGSDELDEVLRAIVVECCRVADGERAALLLATDADLELVVALDRDGDPLTDADLMTRSLPAQAMTSGTAVVVSDTEGPGWNPDSSPSVFRSGLRSVICIPLPGGERPAGVLYVDSQHPGTAFGSTERALLEALAVHASLALARAETRREMERAHIASERQLSRRNAALEARLGATQPLGDSPPMRAVLEIVRRIANADVTACLLGETGTGKEVLARWIHRSSGRAEKPFVVVDCGALPETLIESELFGHERGAFTGAVAGQPGRFRQAESGTLLLDEIGDLPLTMQSRLLRVLQERVVQPIGGRPVAIDVRVLCATHRDLEAMVAEGTFREDLFYRISVVSITVPPLRDRGDDVLVLARAALARLGGRKRFGVDAELALQRHEWPGNVRELEHRVQRAVLLATGSFITAFDLGLGERGEDDATADADEFEPLQDARAEAADRFERVYLRQLMSRAEGSMAQAARLSGVSRQLLHRLLTRHGIDRTEFLS